MSDDWYEGMKDAAKQHRARVEPDRMKYAESKLIAAGAIVRPGPDGFRSFRVTFKTGRQYVFWPWKGWWQGKTQGRGIAELIKSGTEAVNG